jgi:hypothetical protein
MEQRVGSIDDFRADKGQLPIFGGHGGVGKGPANDKRLCGIGESRNAPTRAE